MSATVFYVLLPVLASSVITLNSTTQIDIRATNSVTIQNATNTDECFRLEIGSSALYHLSTENLFQVWALNNLTDSMSSKNFSNVCSSGMTDFSVNPSENLLGTLCSQNRKVFYYWINLDNPKKYFDSATNTSLNAKATRIFINNYTTYEFYPLYSKNDAIMSRSLFSSSVYNLNSRNVGINISPNKKIIVLWDTYSNVYIYNSSNFALMHTFTPNNTPSSLSTQKINFNSKSTLIAIETDTSNPIIILNLSSFAVKQSINYSQKIVDIQFIDSSDQFLHIVGQTSNSVVDLSTIKVYPQQQTVSSSIRVTDWNRTIYSCKNNQITQYSFVLISSPNNSSITTNSASNAASNATSNAASNATSNAASNATSNAASNATSNAASTATSNSTSNSINNTNQPPSNANATKNSSNSSQSNSFNDKQFYFSLNLSELESKLDNGVGTGLNYMMKVTNKITSVSAATPFTIYFLTFINYFSLSGIYVLLNFPLPQQLYGYLSLIYANINTDIFNMLGISFSLPSIAPQKVNRERPLYFKVSSDFLCSNFSQIVLICLNFIIIAIWRWVCCFVHKNSIIKKYYLDSKWEMIFGQIIGIALPVLLPFRFFLFSGGIQTFGSKINFLLNLIFTFISILSPFLYLYYLLMKRKLVNKENKENASFALQTNRISNEAQLKIKIVRLQSKRYFKEPFSVQVFDKWLIYVANVLYPLFVLSQNPIYFLIVIMVFTITNVLITLKAFKRNKNMFFLKLYPLIFHSCFFVFYLCDDESILIITEIACLICLLAGSIHILITTLVSGFTFLIRIVKFIFKWGQVKESPSSNKPSKAKKMIRITYHPASKTDTNKEALTSPVASKTRLATHFKKVRKCKDKARYARRADQRSSPKIIFSNQ